MEVETTEYEPCETGVVEVKDFVPRRASSKSRLVCCLISAEFYSYT